MALRYFWIISLTTKSVVFLRRFPTVEKRAQNFGHKEVIITGDDLLVDAMLTSLAINRVTDDEAFQLSSRNELPVVGLKYKDNNLWPILVIEQNGFLFCGFPFCESHPKSDTIELIDDKSIALCFTCLQTIARYFTADKGLSWIEWLITSMAPFGTLINQNYEPLNQKKQTGGQRVNKLETKLQQNELKLSVNELISRTKDKELIYGTLTIDHPNHNYNGLVNVKLRAIDSLNLVLPPNCTQNGFILQIRPAYHNPLHLVHYKCNSNNSKTFLTYNYNINAVKNEKNLYKIQLTLNIRNGSQFKFNYFNIIFRQILNHHLNPLNPIQTIGQLKYENNDLLWVIGSKLPKSGTIKIIFDMISTANKVSELETVCNFKVENFQTSLIYSDCHHLTVDDLNCVSNSKMPFIIDSSLTTIDYKLFAEINL